MSLIFLQTAWFILIGVLIAGYAVLDGFDLGVGSLYLFTKDDTQRAVMRNSIAPFWDGNEVWLLTGGGAIFAAFPEVYATVFSGFYLALILLLAALIFRGTSIEFRGKVEKPGHKKFFDVAIFMGSILPPVLLGVAFGNIMRGIPVDAAKEFSGTFFTLLNPYAVLVGLVSLVMFWMHGGIYLAMKSEGLLQDKAKGWALRSWTAFTVLYAAAIAASFFFAKARMDAFISSPAGWAFGAVAVLGLFSIRCAVKAGNFGRAFIYSSLTIIGVIGAAAAGLFPNLVPSTYGDEFSLTVMNSSSSQLTLSVMLLLAGIGVPIMLVYSIYIYRAFRGKVSASEEGY
ncbi:MAG TPA: cytochrome d ubiquinol oxidase subunit II [Nitrospirota bacterium]